MKINKIFKKSLYLAPIIFLSGVSLVNVANANTYTYSNGNYSATINFQLDTSDPNYFSNGQFVPNKDIPVNYYFSDNNGSTNNSGDYSYSGLNSSIVKLNARMEIKKVNLDTNNNVITSTNNDSSHFSMLKNKLIPSVDSNWYSFDRKSVTFRYEGNYNNSVTEDTSTPLNLENMIYAKFFKGNLNNTYSYAIITPRTGTSDAPNGNMSGGVSEYYGIDENLKNSASIPKEFWNRVHTDEISVFTVQLHLTFGQGTLNSDSYKITKSGPINSMLNANVNRLFLKEKNNIYLYNTNTQEYKLFSPLYGDNIIYRDLGGLMYRWDNYHPAGQGTGYGDIVPVYNWNADYTNWTATYCSSRLDGMSNVFLSSNNSCSTNNVFATLPIFRNGEQFLPYSTKDQGGEYYKDGTSVNDYGPAEMQVTFPIISDITIDADMFAVGGYFCAANMKVVSNMSECSIQTTQSNIIFTK